VAVASKCGIDVLDPDHRVTNSSSHIKEYVEGTIQRLGFAPDLYYLHRIDPSTFGAGSGKLHTGSRYSRFTARHTPRRVHRSSGRDSKGGEGEVHRSLGMFGCNPSQGQLK
jgi:aryl-alcohol dehydrogenase-like predicted oxidoreductase